MTRVHSLREAAQKQLQDAVTTAIEQLRAAIRAMAEAKIKREISEPTTPGDQQVHSFEVAIMDMPGVPRKELSRVPELHWLQPGRRYDSESAAKIKVNPNGSPYISHDDQTTIITSRRYFDRVAYSDWIGRSGVSVACIRARLPA
ncbi:hypothetical protein [Bradyrhizobium sp. SBR1B]|uniref:hypothetical protein n=1 Tax=Bradyrhizobium sp. SBR1B TaxID=2663836 RepID=UPI001606D1F5|nr:hypothetical protein [Bradyrhizobium sp. SBR1B]MBB4383322.1 hypothetical protein [Bradyrhizobium sp. SBR1B]